MYVQHLNLILNLYLLNKWLLDGWINGWMNERVYLSELDNLLIRETKLDQAKEPGCA